MLVTVIKSEYKGRTVVLALALKSVILELDGMIT